MSFSALEALFNDLNEAVSHIEEMHMETIELASHIMPQNVTGRTSASVPIFSSDMFAEDGEHDYEDVCDGIIMNVWLWATDDRWGARTSKSMPHEFEYPADLSPDDAVKVVQRFVDEHLSELVYAVHQDAEEMLDLARSHPRVAVLIAEIAPVIQDIYNDMMGLNDLDD